MQQFKIEQRLGGVRTNKLKMYTIEKAAVVKGWCKTTKRNDDVIDDNVQKMQ